MVLPVNSIQYWRKKEYQFYTISFQKLKEEVFIYNIYIQFSKSFVLYVYIHLKTIMFLKHDFRNPKYIYKYWIYMNI